LSLGAAFPPTLQRQAAARAFRVGAVLKLVATLDDGVAKEKRFVVVGIDANALLCVMNTELHPLITGNAAVLRCQIALAPPMPFVDRACYLDCSRLRRFPVAEVIRQLQDDLARHLGDIPLDVRDEIRAAIQHAPTIAPADANVIVAALDAMT
jgi:hypothetical protein